MPIATKHRGETRVCSLTVILSRFSRTPITFLLAVAPVFLVACPRKQEGAEAAKGEAGGKDAPGKDDRGEKGAQAKGGGGRRGRGGQSVPTVEVAKVGRKETASLVSLPVTLEGRRQVEVYSRVAGRVKAIAREVGAKVAAGQTLFSVDRSEPGDTFLAVPVQSPITGTVAQWYVTPGDQIAAAERAVLVVDDTALRAKLNLPTQEWQGVTRKTEITLEVEGQKRTAKVVSVARAVQAASGKGLVEVEVPNAKFDWKAGMGASAVVKVAPRPRLVVSARALLLTSDGAFLYTVEDGVAHRKKVTFVPRSPDEVELTGDALPDGSLVVVTGASRLAEGTRVQIASENGEKADGSRGEGSKAGGSKVGDAGEARANEGKTP